jgi:hypothetical protein
MNPTTTVRGKVRMQMTKTRIAMGKRRRKKNAETSPTEVLLDTCRMRDPRLGRHGKIDCSSCRRTRTGHSNYPDGIVMQAGKTLRMRLAE